MFVSSTYIITGLLFNYGCPTSSVACVIYWVTRHLGRPTLKGFYVCYLYLQNHWLTLYFSVPYLKCNLCLYTLCPKSVGYTILMGVQHYLQPMFVSSTYRTIGLQYSYRGATLKATYVCKLFLENYWVTLHL